MRQELRSALQDHWHVGRNGFSFIGGIENMQISYGSPESCVLDVFGLNGHESQWREDLTKLCEAGTQLVRYPIPWHRIERTRGDFDWQWLDEVLSFARGLGLELIVDPCHMKSFPLWLKGGFLNPEFPVVYLEFVKRLAGRYPWLTHWTPFNEPITSAVLWGRNGAWCPDGKCDQTFVRALANICRGCCEVANWLRQDRRSVLIQVEAIEHHRTWPRDHPRWDSASENLAAFHNGRAMLATDLILGKVGLNHPMARFLFCNGLEMDEIHWFQENPAPLDILGWDYYAHVSEHFWQTGKPGWQQPGPLPAGLFEMFKKYITRYPGYDVILGETNIPGFVTDRLSWLRYVTEVSVKVQSWLRANQRPEQFWGLCWFPSFDSHSWSEAEMARVTCSDPNGIWWIDGAKRRHDSELSQTWSGLCQGDLGYRDIPIYPFNPELTQDLASFRPLLPQGVFPDAEKPAKTWQLEVARASG